MIRKFFAAIVAFFQAVLSLLGCNISEYKPVTTVSEYNIGASDYQLDIDASNEIKDISELLYGIFFEDINFAADGGLYAEMVANRSFEFTELARDNQMYAWSTVGGAEAEVKINDNDCLNENNPNYLVVKNNATDYAGVQNRGFLEGLSVKDAEYNFSVYAKALNGYNGDMRVRLVQGKEILCEGVFTSLTDKWEKYEINLTCTKAASKDVKLQVLIGSGEVAVDMVSLFPAQTYKGRENGLREDIASMLEELEPKFLRFPGGCVTEGYDENTAYDWKASVGADKNGNPLLFNGKYGDVAARRQGINIWTDINATDDPWPSFMSYGLGFYEFFQLSEDIGAVGVPVINCGLYCQSRTSKAVEIGTPEFERYIDDMLDLVEFCRGDESTIWGKVRCSLGHEEPFELRYICVGNENFGEGYFERYNEFVKAFEKAKAENPALYEGIELIYSSGVDDATSDPNHIDAFKYASDKLSDMENNFAGAIDQHYYNDPSWFFRNADYYDEENYSRTTDGMSENHGGKINVFLGEYASWSNRMSSALSECAYMTGLERNGDIVAMSTYAPLLSSVTARHWAPDLIWFDNTSAMGSVNYYTQMLFSKNQGTKLLSSSLDGANIGDRELSGKVGVGTWSTSAKFDNVKVTDNKTGKVLAEDNFKYLTSLVNWEKGEEGKFRIKGGSLVQTSTDGSKVGAEMYFGDSSWSDYTFTVDATKIKGQEGFFIPFAVRGDDMFLWNIGGYGNTVSCLQENCYGAKSGQILGTVKSFAAEEGKTYQLKIEVSGTKIKCYIDGELYVDYDSYSASEAEAYQVVSTDETGDIIVKLVNVTGDSKTFAVNIGGASDISDKATAYQVATEDFYFENVFGSGDIVTMETFELDGISNQFNLTVPQYSATVIRIPNK